jgi:ABC-2 type transport system ATP-binding protein
MSDAIAIAGLKKSFGATAAVDGLELRVAPGRIFGLVGPDGAGKTTTLRMLCGALSPDAGSISVAGVDVRQRPDEARRRIGYVAQRFSLYGDLTVGENIRFFADIYGVPYAARADLTAQLLAFSRLEPFQARRADALSGGMKQKLALACALIHRPEVLILDEPTTGVDPVARREFWDLLSVTVTRDGLTVIIATPAMDEADRCHTVGFMRAGRLLASGTPRELQRSIPGAVLELRAEPLRGAEAAVRSLAGIRDVQVVGDRLHLFADPAPSESALRERLAGAGARLVSVRPIIPTMEDVYLQMTRSAGGPAAAPPSENSNASTSRS